MTIELTELAREVLELLGRTHRKPGARMLISTLAARLRSTEPPITAAISELIRAGYLAAPDAETIELTAEGFDAIQRGV
jgi:Mn-dependent DtxR family transcriptional regulator